MFNIFLRFVICILTRFRKITWLVHLRLITGPSSHQATSNVLSTSIATTKSFLPLPAHPLMLRLPLLTRHCFRPASVRATAIGRDAERNAVLAGDPKRIRLLCNTSLITNIPSRGSKEERIRIHLQVRPNIQNNGYKR